MKASWKEVFFKDFIKLNRGFDLPNNMIEDGEYPVIASTSIKAYHKNFKVKAPCVVTGRSGSLGVVQYVNQDGWPLNTSLYVKDFKGNNPKFVYYFLQTMNLDGFNSGAGVPTLNQNHLHYLKIFIPKDINHQKRIASILSAYDDLIEVNNKRIELLEQSARELYKEWFVRMRFPNYQNTKFNKGIPEGWEEKKLGKIVDITSSKRIFLSEYTNEGIPFYRGKEISMLSRGESINDILYISNERYEDIKSKFGVPKEGDILITAVGTIGNTYRVDNHKFYFKDGNLIWLRIENENLSSFLHLLLSSQFMSDLLDSFSIGSSQSALTIDILKKVTLLRPKEDILINFSCMSKPIYNQIENLQKQNQELTEIRNRLLPRLISGKLEVKA